MSNDMVFEKENAQTESITTQNTLSLHTSFVKIVLSLWIAYTMFYDKPTSLIQNCVWGSLNNCSFIRFFIVK